MGLFDGIADLFGGKVADPTKPEVEARDVTEEEKNRVRSVLGSAGDRIQQQIQNTGSSIDRSKIRDRGTTSIQQTTPMKNAQVGNVAPRTATQLNQNSIRQGGQGANILQSQAQRLEGVASGATPGVSELAFRKATEDNLAAQQAALASQRGGFDPAMARQVSQQSADIQTQAARDLAQAKLAEQAAAEQQLTASAANEAQAQAQLRGQDIGLATTEAQLQDRAREQQFDADVRVALEDASFLQEAFRADNQAELQTNLQQAMLDDKSLSDAYQGDIEMAKADLNAGLQLLDLVQRGELSMADARANAEQWFIEQGLEEYAAQQRAQNIFTNAVTVAQNTRNQRNAKLIRGAVGAGAELGATMASGGSNQATKVI